MNEKCKHCAARTGIYCGYLEEEILYGHEDKAPCEDVDHHSQT